MEEIFVSDKQKFINEEYPFEDAPKLTDKFRCLHCGEVINVGDYKIFRDETGEKYIYCPNAPECNGTIIDWVDVNANR